VPEEVRLSADCNLAGPDPIRSHNRPLASTAKTDLLQGTLDLLVLRILTLGPNHGWGISNRIRQMSKEGLTASQRSLYPFLHRLELADTSSPRCRRPRTTGRPEFAGSPRRADATRKRSTSEQLRSSLHRSAESLSGRAIGRHRWSGVRHIATCLDLSAFVVICRVLSMAQARLLWRC